MSTNQKQACISWMAKYRIESSEYQIWHTTLPVCFHKERTGIGIITISKIDATTAYGTDFCYLCCLSF